MAGDCNVHLFGLRRHRVTKWWVAEPFYIRVHDLRHFYSRSGMLTGSVKKKKDIGAHDRNDHVVNAVRSDWVPFIEWKIGYHG